MNKNTVKNVKNNDELIAKAKANRKLISLRGKILNARYRWEKSVQEHSSKVLTVSGDAARSPTKKLYIVRSGLWWNQIQTEINNLELAIVKAGYVGAKKPRTLWLPVVIENAIKITLNIYSAKSVRNVSIAQARAFAKKAGCELKQNHDQFSIHSQTGRDYAIRVKSKHGIEIHSFTEWAVCLCQKGSQNPRFRKSDKRHDLSNQLRTKSSSSEMNLDEPICLYKNSALYIKKSVFPDGNISPFGSKEVATGEEDDYDTDWD